MGEPASSGSRAAASVLFVCMGNICRSPAAEGVMRSCLAARGLDGRVEVESAGTIDYHAGEPADARMRRAAAGRGYDLTSTASRVRLEDLERFDLIVAMDRSNLEDLRRLAGRAAAGTAAKLRLLSDFLPAGSPRDVPDPYWGGERGFDEVLDLIEEACPRILDGLVGDG
jgi:protein-tyrosine phosphatase